jgi:hypothetical protein
MRQALVKQRSQPRDCGSPMLAAFGIAVLTSSRSGMRRRHHPTTSTVVGLAASRLDAIFEQTGNGLVAVHHQQLQLRACGIDFGANPLGNDRFAVAAYYNLRAEAINLDFFI